MSRLVDIWPLAGLRVRVGDVEMCWPTTDQLVELADLARHPIHDPDTMPFSTPWTDAPEEERIRSVLQWHWRCAGTWEPDKWSLNLVALRDGRVVGTQGVVSEQFALKRSVESGSWVGRPYQGSGVGTAMRQAMLHLVFAGLGAHQARSGAFADNSASLRVSEKLGYGRDGTDTYVRRGEAATIVRLVLTREEWHRRRGSWPEVEVAGLEPCLSLFGLPPS